MRAWTFRLATTAAFLGVCALPARSAPALNGEHGTSVNPSTERRLRSEIVWIDPATDLAADSQAADISNVLFVNRCIGGCTLTPGPNDSRANTSSIVDETSTISEYQYDQETFDATIQCLREVYGPYNVVIVTEDPGNSPHHEAILAGDPAEIGRAANVGGLAPAACEPLNNVISFSFANTIGSTPLQQCWTVAQESAHAFGLPNHVLDCSDPMTYISGCGQKFFRNKGYQCGDFAAEECRCTENAQQNSHLELLGTFGPGTPPAPPEITILEPAPEASVDEGFRVLFNAIDPRLVDEVELFINGTRYGSLPGYAFDRRNAVYSFTQPEHADGYLNIQIRASNDLESESAVNLRVLKGDPCTSNDQCFPDQSCNEGACAYPQAVLELGEECEFGYECLSGLCPSNDGDTRCSDFCTVSNPFTCPPDFECLPLSGDRGVCWEDAGSSDGGGCCSLSGASPSRTGGLALIVLVGLALVWRRKRS